MVHLIKQIFNKMNIIIITFKKHIQPDNYFTHKNVLYLFLTSNQCEVAITCKVMRLISMSPDMPSPYLQSFLDSKIESVLDLIKTQTRTQIWTQVS